MDDHPSHLYHLSLVRLALSQQYRVLRLTKAGMWRDEKDRTVFNTLRISYIDNDSLLVSAICISTTRFLRHMPEVFKVNLMERLLSER